MSWLDWAAVAVGGYLLVGFGGTALMLVVGAVAGARLTMARPGELPDVAKAVGGAAEAIARRAGPQWLAWAVLRMALTWPVAFPRAWRGVRSFVVAPAAATLELVQKVERRVEIAEFLEGLTPGDMNEHVLVLAAFRRRVSPEGLAAAMWGRGGALQPSPEDVVGRAQWFREACGSDPEAVELWAEDFAGMLAESAADCGGRTDAGRRWFEAYLREQARLLLGGPVEGGVPAE